MARVANLVDQHAICARIDPRDAGKRATVKAVQRLNWSSGILAASVLLDSAVEHYRGNFENPPGDCVAYRG